MIIKRTPEFLDEDVIGLTDKERDYSNEIDRKMRLFVNMIIDRVLEDRKKGILHTTNKSTIVKGEHEN